MKTFKKYKHIIKILDAAEKYLRKELITKYDFYINSSNKVVCFSKQNWEHKMNILRLLETRTDENANKMQ